MNSVQSLLVGSGLIQIRCSSEYLQLCDGVCGIENNLPCLTNALIVGFFLDNNGAERQRGISSIKLQLHRKNFFMGFVDNKLCSR